MISPWNELLSAGSESTSESLRPLFPDVSMEGTDLERENAGEQEALERELGTYLEFCKEGKSLMMNLKNRKEFYRLDLFEHLYSGTMGKEVTEEGKAVRGVEIEG